MSKDPDIRAALRKRLDEDVVDSGLPSDTLHKAKLRRRRAMATTAVGGIGLVMLSFLGFWVIQSPDPTRDQAPVSTPTPEESTTPREKSTYPDQPIGQGPLEAPPPVTIKTPDQVIDLFAWSYCHKTGCVNGSPPNPPHIGSPEQVIVEFPLEEWSFSANFTPADERCGRNHTVRLEPTAAGRFVLRPAGYADTYDVSLFGEGNGSLSVGFRWTTPTDGPLPEPEAHAAILSGEGGQITSYGIELSLSNLAETPKEASATITVEDADGDSITFEPELARRPPCPPEGSVYWDGPNDKGLEAAQLGPGPFEYIVELTLDGKRYVGTATWPNDEIRGNEPSVSLDFSPELPRVR